MSDSFSSSTDLILEPLLIKDANKYTMFPIQHSDVWKMYKKHVDCFWRAEEVDLSADEKDWKTLSPEEQHFIKMVLAFFSSSDGIVAENLSQRFMKEIENSEIRAFYAVQMFMETIHSETYSLLIDTYVKESQEKLQLFQAIENFPCIKKKAEWGVKWIEDKEADFATRLVAFCIIEGLFFSGSFCAIFWLKKRGLMPGLTLSNEFISRDESLHTQFACLLYSKIVNRLPKERFEALMKEAVEIEIEFINYALNVSVIGMNKNLMEQYVKMCSDRLSLQLGYEKIYHATNPFEWMTLISLSLKNNFFEGHSSQYSLPTKSHNTDFSKLNLDF